MGSGSVTPTLGRRFLVTALLVAVVPLGTIGFWATRSAARSGRLLLRSQLEAQMEQVLADVEQRWERLRGDLLAIGESEPVRVALLDASSVSQPVPAFVQRMFEEATAFTHVTIRDRWGVARWTLENGQPTRNDVELGADGEAPAIDVSVPLTDLIAGDTLGVLEASLRIGSLLPSAATLATASGPLTAFSVRNGRLVTPPGADERLFSDEGVIWSGSTWLSVRQASALPDIEIVMAGPLDPFVGPFERAAQRAAVALLATAGLVVIMIVTLTRRVTREVERELAQREALAAVGEFASELSHEVRNPLTAIRLDLQRVEEAADQPESVRGIVSRVLGQVDRMDRTVTGVLRVARGGSIEPKAVDLRDVLESARRAAEPELERRGARLSIELEGSQEFAVNGDAGALEQLFLNLMLNAAQSLSRGGLVNVTLAKLNGGLRVTIADDGRGMTADELSRIDRPYRSSRKEGTGLGLKIARRVVAGHGGVMEVTSTPGVGTTVSVRLP